MKFTCTSCSHEWDLTGIPGKEITCPRCGERMSFEAAPTAKYSRPPTPETDPDGERPLKMEDDRAFATGALFGPYRVTGFLGRGGMGTVYEAEHTMLKRKAALKILPARFSDDEEFVQRFQREAMTLANLNHPGIVAVHDMGVQGEIYYLAMEYVDGTSLRDVMGTEMLSPEQALRLVPQLCEALEYAHSRSIIHRDIKPENILLTREGQAKIADFGLAKILRGDRTSPPLTQTNVIMGTPDYMAPEQRGSLKMVDHRADIYSLGVVLYEMLTGELPVGKFEVPSKRIRIDMKIDEVVLRALENSPEKRYQKASDMGTDVRTVHEKKSPVVLPPSDHLPFAEVFRDAFRIFGTRSNWFLLTVAALIVELLTLLTGFVLAGPMLGGAMVLCLKIYRSEDRRAQVGDVFDGFNRFLPLFGLFWVRFLALTALFVCLILPGVIFYTLWMYAVLVMVDRNCGIREALRESSAIVRRIGFWPHFGLAMILLLLNIASYALAVLPGIGLVLDAIITSNGWLALTSAYLRLKAPSSAA